MMQYHENVFAVESMLAIFLETGKDWDTRAAVLSKGFESNNIIGLGELFEYNKRYMQLIIKSNIYHFFFILSRILYGFGAKFLKLLVK